MTPSAILRHSDNEEKQIHFLKYKEKEKGGTLPTANFHHKQPLLPFLLRPKNTLVLGRETCLLPGSLHLELNSLKLSGPALRSRFIEGELGRQFSEKIAGGKTHKTAIPFSHERMRRGPGQGRIFAKHDYLSH